MSPTNLEGREIVGAWLNEILDDLQQDDAHKFSNADCARRAGIDDTIVGDMRAGKKAVSAHFIMRQRWEVRRRLLKKLETFLPRGGDDE